MPGNLPVLPPIRRRQVHRMSAVSGPVGRRQAEFDHSVLVFGHEFRRAWLGRDCDSFLAMTIAHVTATLAVLIKNLKVKKLCHAVSFLASRSRSALTSAFAWRASRALFAFLIYG